MIAQITFEGTIKSGKKKSVQADKVLMNCVELSDAKVQFLHWVDNINVIGIRGEKMFHPLNNVGSIKLVKVAEFNG